MTSFWTDVKTLAKVGFLGAFGGGVGVGVLIAGNVEALLAIALVGAAFLFHGRAHRRESDMLLRYADDQRNELAALKRIYSGV
jgi:hypothetical protein